MAGGGVGHAGAIVAAGAAAVLTAALWGAGVRSWRRTAAVRRGHDAVPSAPVGYHPSSRTTWLASAAGAAIVAWGSWSLGTGGLPAFAAIGAGALIAISGIRSRVAGLEVGPDRIVVHRAGRPTFLAPWNAVTRLRRPRTPIGGWRLEVHGRSITLMPSDILGNEAVLALIIERSGLRFDGRCWSAHPPIAVTDRS
jgi:hypothetical protein